MGKAVAAVRWRTYSALAYVAGAERRVRPSAVALTFDDGPDPESTSTVLDILAEHRVPATFFCVGYLARQYPDLVQRMVAEGHEVGSHSETHRVLGLRAREAMADFRQGHRSVEDVVGRSLTLFRPPNGRLTWGSARALRAEGLRTWFWTVDPKDYAPGTTAACALKVVDRLAGSDVVLMHDGLEGGVPGAPPRSLLHEYLPRALTTFKRRGFDFVTLGRDR